MKFLVGLALVAVTGVTAAHSNHTHVESNSEIEKLIIAAKSSGQESDYLKVKRILVSTKSTDPKINLYRAEIQQHFHEFDNALASIERAPDMASTNLIKANILLTTGKSREAGNVCRKLFGKTDDLIALSCLAQAMSRHGDLNRSFTLLENFVEKHKNSSPDGRHWAYVVLAEMAERMANTDIAERYYKKAIQLRNNDVVSRIAYADLLLKQNRYELVSKLAKDYLDNDALLLRYVRALNIKGDLRNDAYFCELKRRVLNYQASEDKHVHYDLLAEYYHYFNQSQDEALKWVKLHWQQQKTPRDARLLARISSHVVDNVSLDLLLDWRHEQMLEDRLLDQLLGSSEVAVRRDQ